MIQSDDEGASHVTVAYIQSQTCKSFAKLRKTTGTSAEGEKKPSLPHRWQKFVKHDSAVKKSEGAPSGSSTSKCTGKCFNCGKIWHYAAVCRASKICVYNVLEHPSCRSTLHNVCVCACKQQKHFMDKDDCKIALTIVSQLGPQQAWHDPGWSSAAMIQSDAKCGGMNTAVTQNKLKCSSSSGSSRQPATGEQAQVVSSFVGPAFALMLDSSSGRQAAQQPKEARRICSPAGQAGSRIVCRSSGEAVMATLPFLWRAWATLGALDLIWFNQPQLL